MFREVFQNICSSLIDSLAVTYSHLPMPWSRRAALWTSSFPLEILKALGNACPQEAALIAPVPLAGRSVPGRNFRSSQSHQPCIIARKTSSIGLCLPCVPQDWTQGPGTWCLVDHDAWTMQSKGWKVEKGRGIFLFIGKQKNTSDSLCFSLV
jgi:hypothetical protein